MASRTKQIGDWAYHSGVRRLFIVNTHVTNAAPLRCALEMRVQRIEHGAGLGQQGGLFGGFFAVYVPSEDMGIDVDALAVGQERETVGARAGRQRVALLRAHPGRHVAAVFGVINSMGALGGAVSQLLFGSLPRTNWDQAFYVASGLLLLGALCWSQVDARRVIFKESL